MPEWTILSGLRRKAAPASAGLSVDEVRSARDRDRFVEFPGQIYEKDRHWVPPLLIQVKEFLDPRRHPFCRHGTATTFLARSGGRVVGRILVSDDPNYNAQYGSNVGCFGMFECVDDPAVAAALLEAAAGWLRARGRTEIMGPMDYSTNYPVGLLIDGFDTPPRIMMNHNPPYYAGLLESWGLGKIKDLYAWWFDDPHDIVRRWKERAERIVRRTGAVVRPFRINDFEAEVRRCQAVYNGARQSNWGFVPVTEAEFTYFAQQLRQMAVPELVLLAEIKGEPVGFSITLPDYNEAIGPLSGRLTTFGVPVGLFRLLYRRRHIENCRVLVLDVQEGYRRRGLGELLILNTLAAARRAGFSGHAELGWTLEDNRLINRMIEAVGGRRYKTYRIYQKRIS
jgi:GNAT superfamily N-acetyltransferase